MARFIGEPEINILSAKLISRNDKVYMKVLGQDVNYRVEDDVAKVLKENNHDNIKIGLRANDISFSLNKENEEYMEGKVYSVEPIGNKTILVIDVNDQLLRLTAPNDLQINMDTDIFVRVDMKRSMFFDANTSEYIYRHNQNELLGVKCYG